MIHVVIGAQFGDEGKGLVTDYLSRPETLVVRFNGGAQAGHTVVTPEGRRHDFHHLGAGTFRGAATLLARSFLVNPVLFRREHQALLTAGHVPAPPSVLVDDGAQVTTPWDMLLNQATEQARGAARHGSCGVGVNETVARAVDGCTLWAGVLRRTGETHRFASNVRAYAAAEAHRRGLAMPDAFADEATMSRFLQDCAYFVRHTVPCDDAETIRATRDDIVFEGAQGLRLDEKARGFPHVTRSRTGLTNVLALLDAAGRRDPFAVAYVTRCYVTRHGAGPLVGEIEAHPFGWVGPETNVEGPYQGRLRYAPLDPDALHAAIVTDLSQTVLHDVLPSLAVTCLDQSGGRFGVSQAQDAARAVGIPLGFVSSGPTREDVVEPVEVEAR